jgi:drug/metabolite transporter (DMT)-like permease
MEWLPLTLLSAFSLASADAATKWYLSDRSARELLLVRFTLPGLLLTPLLLLEPWPDLPPVFWLWVGALIPLELLAMALYMRSIRDGAFAHTLPYLAFTPVFATFTGFWLLGESISLLGFGGILLVTSGAYLLNLHHAFDGGRWALLKPLQVIITASGPRSMLLVAALYSLTSVMGKGAMRYAPPAFFGPFYFGVLGLATLLLFGLGSRHTLPVLWRRPGPNLLIGAAMAIMVVTHFLAIQQVEVAYMIALKRTSLLFGILYGALLFREARLTQHLAAGSLMVAGVFLILI